MSWKIHKIYIELDTVKVSEVIITSGPCKLLGFDKN